MVNRNSFFKRRFFRIPFNDPVEFSILKFREQEIAHLSSKKGRAVGKDLGEDGISFISAYRLPADMILRIVLKLPTGEKRLLAKVVRNQALDGAYFTAVQFINLQGVRREELRSYIAAETKKTYKCFKYM